MAVLYQVPQNVFNNRVYSPPITVNESGPVESLWASALQGPCTPPSPPSRVSSPKSKPGGGGGPEQEA